jgi:hypothetical protein
MLFVNLGDFMPQTVRVYIIMILAKKIRKFGGLEKKLWADEVLYGRRRACLVWANEKL